jgi:mannose-6-phosphate isomerase-like protein (cupin superfamily)
MTVCAFTIDERRGPREGGDPATLFRRQAMKRRQLKFGKGFRVAIGNERSQAAEMVIPPGAAEGDSKNRHDGADQWLFVVAGTGRATINGKKYPLSAGTLLLIERGDEHEIRNVGRSLLRTLNFYVPPAYGSDEKPLMAAKPGG